MFTGIITHRGTVRRIARGGDTRIEIATEVNFGPFPMGASIACSGVCLTVVAFGTDWFALDASAETLSKTTVGAWREGTPVNLERALRVGDELGGHFVLGHVDGVADVVARRPEGDSLRFTIAAPVALARFIAPKGSVVLDGVSLTVNEVDRTHFGINVIPHTAAVTTLGAAEPGARWNLEIDPLARYVARLADAGIASVPGA